MTKEFISCGFIKKKLSGSPYYMIILEDSSIKTLTGSNIKGNRHINAQGRLYHILSETKSYYEFEVTE